MIAATTSSASSPSRTMMKNALTAAVVGVSASGFQLFRARIEQCRDALGRVAPHPPPVRPAQQVAVDDHLRFHGLAQITVHRVETRLDELEAFQVAGERESLRFAALPALVGSEALFASRRR